MPTALQADRPKLLSPRFADMFDATTYAALRRDRFQIHFQYLLASNHAVPYDYFAITADHQSLAQCFARIPSVTDFSMFRLFNR